MVQAWAPEGDDFATELSTPDEVAGGMYMSRQEALSEVVNRMWYTVENTAATGSAARWATRPAATSQPQAVESPTATARSRTSWIC